MSTANASLGTQKKSAFYSKPLENDHEIKIAQRLVYQVFANEIGWAPDQANLSGIRFVNDSAGTLFVDDFDDVATWFGTFHNQELIACWRFCEPQNGKFELEHYHAIPDFLKVARSLEVTRLVIHSKYRNRSRVMLDLTQTTYKHLWYRFDYTFAAVEFPNPGNLYLKLGLKQVDVKPFKYSPWDKNEVQLIVFDFKDKTTIASGYGKYSQ